MRAILGSVLSIALLVMADQAYALRCGNKLVDRGDRKHRVLYACGEPSYIDAYDRPISGAYFLYTHVEIWTYNFGPTRFMYELIFEKGVLVRINQLGYGY